MPKKRTNSERSKETIVAAADTLIRRKGAASITVDQVAKEAGCAKGLVHYHFKTKRGVIEAVAQHVAASRTEAWVAAFRAPTPKGAIDQSWSLLTRESVDGTIRAWTSMFGQGGVIPEQTVRKSIEEFAGALGRAADELLRDLDLEPTILPEENGWLLGAVVHGMGLELLSGADQEELEGAYAAAWLGILSLATPS
ncbi:MAG: TetR/AcrR family transcriptional regulator [Gemmatimonadota bacterium]|nr:MAG: TetR/AcrR family transcriptional regulator [Gemmatimonadota bacterium]